MNRRLAVKNREMLTGATQQSGKVEFIGFAELTIYLFAEQNRYTYYLQGTRNML